MQCKGEQSNPSLVRSVHPKNHVSIREGQEREGRRQVLNFHNCVFIQVR